MFEQRRNARILIADDEPVNRELLEAFLADHDYDLEFAEDGQETLEKAVSFEPDLILLDVMMPKFSGFEVCEKLKSDPKTCGVMILMVTALNELGDVERAVSVGCDAVKVIAAVGREHAFPFHQAVAVIFYYDVIDVVGEFSVKAGKISVGAGGGYICKYISR